MLNFYPDDYYHNDTDRFYHDPRRSARQQQQLRRAQLQRQAAVEEERRQRMLYERSMREEEEMRREEMRRREEMVMERRRKADQKRRDELMRRRALEQSRRDAEKRRRILERQWQQERQRELELERRLRVERAEKEEQRRLMEQEKALRGAEYGIVRGPDGRLYKINADDRYGYDGGRMGPLMPLSARNDNGHCPMSTSETSDSDAEESGVVMKGMEAPETTNENIRKKKTDSIQRIKKLKSSVLIGDVEDASDSEQEDLVSVWRNRLPAEGEWMEPVEGYDVYW